MILRRGLTPRDTDEPVDGGGLSLERRAVAGTGGTRALARMGCARFPLGAHGASGCLLAQALAGGLLGSVSTDARPDQEG
jgi:hypothetical protein